MKKSAKEFKCKKGNLPVIRDFVNTWLDGVDVTGKLANQIVLAVDEACANCIIHQHQCDDKSMIEVSMYKKGETVFFEIKDTGKAFPIDQYQPRAMNDIIRKRIKGGLGIYLIHRIMDEIEIEERRGYYIYKFAKHLGRRMSSGM